jgi:regulator of cell morphogenesis and NO signaling
MTITPAAHVADIVAAAPATIAVFQRHHIEFCCAGHVPLQDVCEHEGLDLEGMLRELMAATERFGETRDWQHAPLAQLIAHIQSSYHQPLYHELPRLAAMLTKVVQRHGDRFPDTLPALQATFVDFERDLIFHMRREDAMLFPAIARFATQADLLVTDPHPLLGPITAMEREHVDADNALAKMRSLTSGYEPPADACATFRGLYYGLSELEHRMHLHVHLENDILFPRALELGRSDDMAGVVR